MINILMQAITQDSLELEITSVCTLECPGCSRVNTKHLKSEWDKGHLDFEIIENVIKTTNFKWYNIIGCYGDAIYHPRFWDIIQLLNNEDKNYMLHTNGSSRSQRWWDTALDIKGWHRGHKFCFAIDGLEDTNHYYRINAKWDTILTGLNTMSKVTERPQVIWRMLDFPYNRHQQKDAEALAQSYGMKFEIHPTFRSTDQYKHDNPRLFQQKNIP